MGVCYLLANHSKMEYFATGEKFIEMDSVPSSRRLTHLLTQFWDLRKPQMLEWVGDNTDYYDVIKKRYQNIGEDLKKSFTEWTESDYNNGTGIMIGEIK